MNLEKEKVSRITPVWINQLKPGEVYVFQTYISGTHVNGAAQKAMQWGAKMNKGFGRSGQTFAIPTKDKNLHVLDIELIDIYVEGFFLHARKHPESKFLVTEIGTGAASFRYNDIAPLFREALLMKNVWLPAVYIKHLIK